MHLGRSKYPFAVVGVVATLFLVNLRIRFLGNFEEFGMQLEPPLFSERPQNPEEGYASILPVTKTSEAVKANLTGILEQLLPDPVVPKGRLFRVLTQQTIKRLIQCVAEDPKCEDRPEGKVVIVAYEHFFETTTGSTTGEVIWCESVLVAFERLGYSVLTATSQEEVLHYYRMFPHMVRIVIMQVRMGWKHESNHVRNCFLDENCILSEKNPTGIAPWKIFGLCFWGTKGDPIELHHPWGSSRVLVPYNYPEHFYLGYAIDHHCTANPVVPIEDRKNQAFVLAKKLSYFYDMKNAAFPPEAWQAAQDATGLALLSGARDDIGNGTKLPSGVSGVGRLAREDFYAELGSSIAMIGNGQPVLSPSPFDALCIGVPFIHPYDAEGANEGLNPTGWNVFSSRLYQHGGLMSLRPPHVYHVPRRNVTALIEALQGAQTNPIQGRALPRDYQMVALMERVKGLVVDTDWEWVAKREGRIPE